MDEFNPRLCGCGSRIVRCGRGVGKCETLSEGGVGDAYARWSRPRSSWVCLPGWNKDKARWPPGTPQPDPPHGFVEETRLERVENRPDSWGFEQALKGRAP